MLTRVLLIIGLALALSSQLGASPERVERGNLVLEGMPEIPAEITARLEQYQNTRTAS